MISTGTAPTGPGYQGLAYIAGPMTGHANYNFGPFFEAERRLNGHGWDTVNPAQHDIDEGWVLVTYDDWGGILAAEKREEGAFDWNEALDWDLDALEHCDAIYLLPGWSKSRGASKEYRFAKERGLKIMGAVAESPAPEHDQPLVGLVGYARAGKDTFASALGWTRLAFADPLKELALAINPLVEGPPLDGFADFEQWALQSLIDTVGWDVAKESMAESDFGTRPYLQRIGTAVRDILGYDTWVEAAFAKFDPTVPTVFTDVRFPNEVEAIRGRGGLIVRITREGIEPPNSHVSEQLVATVEPDFDIAAPYHGISRLKAQAVDLNRYLRGGHA